MRPPRRHAAAALRSLDRIVLATTAAMTAIRAPFLIDPCARAAGAALLALTGACAALTARPDYAGRLRDMAAVAYRLVGGALIQFMVSGGRALPVAVESWGQFALGRIIPMLVVLWCGALWGGGTASEGAAATAAARRAAPGPSGPPFPRTPPTHPPPRASTTPAAPSPSATLQLDRHTLPAAAATVAVFIAGQRAACVSLLAGYAGIQGYYEATCAGLRSAAAFFASAFGVDAPGAVAIPPLCPAHACEAVMSWLFAAAGCLGVVLGGARLGGGAGAAPTLVAAGLALALAWAGIELAFSRHPCPPLAPPPSWLQRGARAAAGWPRVRQLTEWPAVVVADVRAVVDWVSRRRRGRG